MKNNYRERMILITFCTLGSIFCFLNFKNQTSKTVFFIGGIVWAIAGIVNIAWLVINSNKKN